MITDDEAHNLIAELSSVKIPGKGDTTNIIWKSNLITLGLNSTLRSLNGGKVNVLIISASIRPKHIVDQIIMLALGRNDKIHILCVPQLNQLLADALGFSTCICLSMSGDLNQPQLEQPLRIIRNLVARFPTSDSYIRPKRSEAPANQSEPKKKPKRELSPVCLDDIYVAKPAVGRSFVPAGTVFETKPSNDWSDFISFGTDTNAAPYEHQIAQLHNSGKSSTVAKHRHLTSAKHSMHKNKNPNRSNYITLGVNRVQPNPNKVKKNKKK